MAPPREPLDRPLLFSSVAELERVFLAAKVGEPITYHVGRLSIDQLRPCASALREVAEYAQLLSQEGRADLASRYNSEGSYEYQLTKRAILDDRVCDYNSAQEQPYRVLSLKEPPRVVGSKLNDRLARKLRSIMAPPAGLTPRQKHELERCRYFSGGR